MTPSAPGSSEASRLLSGIDLHRAVILEGVLEARDFVWIATADLKDMHVARARGYRPVLEQMDALAGQGVAFRIAHSKLPSAPFRDTLERFPRLFRGGLELQTCPRMHTKMVVVDGGLGYLGSANFTGAGLGPRSERRRNFEVGLVTRDPEWVGWLMDLFDGHWIGTHCARCALRRECPDPIR